MAQGICYLREIYNESELKGNKPAKRIDIIRTELVRDRTVLYAGRKITRPEDGAEIFRSFLGSLDREAFAVMCLSTKNEPTALGIISMGSLNASLVHPRETFKMAILACANSIILCHLHPSGDPTPSNEDMETTKRLAECGDLLGIKVIDHLILGDDSFVSLKERGLI